MSDGIAVRADVGRIHRVRIIEIRRRVLDRHHDDTRDAPSGPVLVEFVTHLASLILRVFRRLRPEGQNTRQATMKVVLQNDHWIMSIRMLFPSIGHQNDGSNVGREPPKFCEQIALDADVLQPFVIDDGVIISRRIPSHHGVDKFSFVLDWWNFLCE